MIKMMIIGNLTADPEVRAVNTQNGTRNVTTFTLASNDRRGNATFVRVSTWDKLAESCFQWLKKGSKVFVETNGIEARTYSASNGETRVSLECSASSVEFLTGRDRGDADDSAYIRNAQPAQAPAAPAQARSPYDIAMQNARAKAQPQQVTVDDDQLPF